MHSTVVRTCSLAASLCLLALSAGASSAGADSFLPVNTAPTLVPLSLSSSIQPDDDASAAVYTYSATVADLDTLNDLTAVTLCLYHTTGGSSDCSSLNPANTVKLTWTQATNSFAIDGNSSNSYWALGTGADASSAPADLTAMTGTFSFKFTVSEAMREGGWTAKLTADDGVAAPVSNATLTTTVQHYSAIAARSQKDFGTLAANVPGDATDTPTVTSNGGVFYSMTAGSFTNDSYSFALRTSAGAPTAGQVTFDCLVGGSWSLGVGAVRVGSTATQLSASQLGTGTLEGGTGLANTCRLQHGGGRPVGTYSFTVVNTVGNDA